MLKSAHTISMKSGLLTGWFGCLLTLLVLVRLPLSSGLPVSGTDRSPWSEAAPCRQRGDLWAFSAAAGSCVRLLEPHRACSSAGELMLQSPEEQSLAECGRVSLTSRSSSCPEGQSLTVDLSGRVACDCLPGHVYWPADDECYPLYTRGPCAEKEILSLNVSRTGSVCSVNWCGTGKVLWNNSCVAVGHQGCGPDSSGYLRVDLDTLDLQCGRQCSSGQVRVAGGCHALHERGPCRVDEVVVATAVQGQGDCRTLPRKCLSTTPWEWSGGCWSRGEICGRRFQDTSELQPRTSGFSSEKSSSFSSGFTGWSVLPLVLNFSRPPLLHQYHAYDGKLVKDASLITNLNPPWIGKTDSFHYHHNVVFEDTSEGHSMIRHSIKTKFVNRNLSGSDNGRIFHHKVGLSDEATAADRNRTIFRLKRSTTNNSPDQREGGKNRHQEHRENDQKEYHYVQWESGKNDRQEIDKKDQQRENGGEREWSSRYSYRNTALDHKSSSGRVYSARSLSPGPISPAGPGPISPAGPGPLSSASSGPLSPNSLIPSSPGSLSPASPGTLSPANPGSLNPASPGCLSPAGSGPLSPSTPSDRPSSEGSGETLQVIMVSDYGSVYCAEPDWAQVYRCTAGSRRHVQGRCSPHSCSAPRPNQY